MSGSTKQTQVLNGVTFFTSSANKALALFPRIPREQYNYLLDASKGIGLAKVKALLHEMTTARIVAYIRDMQVIQVNQHKIATFERVQFSAQKGATVLYRRAIVTQIAAARDELKSRNAVAEQEELFGGLPDADAPSGTEALTVPTDSEGGESDGETAFAESVAGMAVTA